MAKVKQDRKVKVSEKPPTITSQQKDERWYLWLILGFSFLLYFNSIFNDYNMDDELVTQNHRLTSKGITAIPEIFKSPYYEDEAGYKYEYRPIVLVTFAIEHSLFGDKPYVSHFVSVLLYGLLCVLLFFVLRKLLKHYSPLFPFLITLLFLVHPIHTEVVASIKNRDEILCLIFGLLSLYFSVQFADGKTFLGFILIPFFFFLGIITKSTIITFALLIPLSIVMFTNVSFKQLLPIAISLILPTIFYSRLYSLAQQILLTIALLVSVVVFYYLKNSEISIDALLRLVNDKYAKMKTSAEQEIKTSVQLDFSFLKNKLVLFSTIVVIFLFTFVSLYGLYLRDPWFSVIPVSLFALIIILVREELKLIFIAPLTLITLYSLTRFNFAFTLIEAGFVVYMGSQFIAGNKLFKRVVGVNYLIYILFSLLVTHSVFFISILFFAGFLKRKWFPVTLLALAFSLYYFSKYIYFLAAGLKEFNLTYIAFPVVYVGVLLLWRRKGYIVRWLSTISIPVFIAFCFATALPVTEDGSVISDLKQNYNKVNSYKAADLTPIQTVRPFGYMESPVAVNDELHVKLGTAMIVLGKYLKLIVVPYPMSYYYGYAVIVPSTIKAGLPLFILFIHVALLLLALFFFRKKPVLSFSILFYLIGISIFSGLVSTVPGMMGDRFLFIPSIGFCFLLAFILAQAAGQDFSDMKLTLPGLKMPVKVVTGAILLVYSAVTFSRNLDWENRLTLFRKDIHAVENSAQAQNLLGVHLLIESNKETDPAKQKSLREEAVTHLKMAVKIYPQFLNASFDLGRAYMMLQIPDSAYTTWEQTRKIDTGFVMPCFMMAAIQYNRGNFPEAAGLYETYLSKYPADAQAIGNLSFVYYKMGEYQKSVDTKKRALTFAPGNFDFLLGIAQTYQQMNQKDSALVYYEQARAIRPSDAMVNQRITELKGTN